MHVLRAERENNRTLKAAWRAKIVSAFVFAFAFACVVCKNLKTPKLSTMAEDAITWGGIGILVSTLYICGFVSLFATFFFCPTLIDEAFLFKANVPSVC